MASPSEKKKRKAAKSAIALRTEARKARNRFSLATAIAIAAILIYFTTTQMGLIEDNPFASPLVIVAAIIIGMLSIKSSRAKSRYHQYLEQHSISDDEVKDEQSYQ